MLSTSSDRTSRVRSVACSGKGEIITVGELDIHNTHANRYMEGFAPDLTIVRRTYPVTSLNAVMVIEAQVGPVLLPVGRLPAQAMLKHTAPRPRLRGATLTSGTAASASSTQS